MQRKFTTILALDVVGFSKLMSIDEDRTLVNLQARRKIIDPLIETKQSVQKLLQEQQVKLVLH